MDAGLFLSDWILSVGSLVELVNRVFTEVVEVVLVIVDWFVITGLCKSSVLELISGVEKISCWVDGVRLNEYNHVSSSGSVAKVIEDVFGTLRFGVIIEPLSDLRCWWFSRYLEPDRFLPDWVLSVRSLIDLVSWFFTEVVEVVLVGLDTVVAAETIESWLTNPFVEDV